MASGDELGDAAQLLSTDGKPVLGGVLSGFSMWGILFSLLFGVIGLFYFKRGMKESDIRLMAAGAGLLVFPYFVSDALYIALIGFALSVLPWIWETFQ